MLYWFLLYNKVNQLYIYTYPLPPESASHAGHPSHPSRSSQTIPLSSPCYAVASQQLSTLHMVVSIYHCYSPNSPHPLLCHCVHKSVLNVCLSTAALQIGSLVTFVQIPHRNYSEVSSHTVRIAINQKSTNNKCWRGLSRKGNPSTLLVGMQIDTVTTENSMEVP